MTREEAITVLEESKRQNKIMIDNPTTFWASHQMADGVKNAKRRIEAFEIALSALRPVSREQVGRMRGQWQWYKPCRESPEKWWGICSTCGHKQLLGEGEVNFCPSCGAPMTGEAVEMVMERLEALYETT